MLIEYAGEVRAGARANVERSLLPEGAREGDVLALSCSLGGGEPQTVWRALSGARVRNRIERLKRRGGQG